MKTLVINGEYGYHATTLEKGRTYENDAERIPFKWFGDGRGAVGDGIIGLRGRVRVVGVGDTLEMRTGSQRGHVFRAAVSEELSDMGSTRFRRKRRL